MFSVRPIGVYLAGGPHPVTDSRPNDEATYGPSHPRGADVYATGAALACCLKPFSHHCYAGLRHRAGTNAVKQGSWEVTEAPNHTWTGMFFEGRGSMAFIRLSKCLQFLKEEGSLLD